MVLFALEQAINKGKHDEEEWSNEKKCALKLLPQSWTTQKLMMMDLYEMITDDAQSGDMCTTSVPFADRLKKFLLLFVEDTNGTISLT